MASWPMSPWLWTFPIQCPAAMTDSNTEGVTSTLRIWHFFSTIFDRTGKKKEKKETWTEFISNCSICYIATLQYCIENARCPSVRAHSLTYQLHSINYSSAPYGRCCSVCCIHLYTKARCTRMMLISDMANSVVGLFWARAWVLSLGQLVIIALEYTQINTSFSLSLTLCHTQTLALLAHRHLEMNRMQREVLSIVQCTTIWTNFKAQADGAHWVRGRIANIL